MQFPHQFNSNQFNYWKLQPKEKKKKTPHFLHQNKEEKLHVVAQEYWVATVWSRTWGRGNDQK